MANWCRHCGRELKDPRSRARGIGPDCEALLNSPEYIARVQAYRDEIAQREAEFQRFVQVEGDRQALLRKKRAQIEAERRARLDAIKAQHATR